MLLLFFKTDRFSIDSGIILIFGNFQKRLNRKIMPVSTTTRNTKHQQAVLKLLKNSAIALTADEIRDSLEHKINKTTVYRMLERFIEAGKVHFVTGQDGKAYYALCKRCSQENEIHEVHNHLHFQCENCGNVECIPETVTIPKLEGYTVHEAQLLLIGVCKHCKS